MAERRKVLEAERASTPTTPTKPRIPSLTPVPIPGVYTPRKVRPSTPWTVQSPTDNVARPNGTPSASAQPLKGILKTPERDARFGGQSKSDQKKPMYRGTRVSWTGDTKRGHGSY
jgi:hypothetical protein